jgi:hypothetical protein
MEEEKMKLSEEATDALAILNIPLHMHGGIIRYCEDKIPPGSFLTAVINNDLREACARADDINRHALFKYIQWFYNYAPSESWGFEGAVEKWCGSKE